MLLGDTAVLEPQPAFFFFFSYFLGRVSHFCLELASDCNLPTYASHIVGTIGMYHYGQFVG
jgi:hypothetical protein